VNDFSFDCRGGRTIFERFCIAVSGLILAIFRRVWHLLGFGFHRIACLTPTKGGMPRLKAQAYNGEQMLDPPSHGSSIGSVFKPRRWGISLKVDRGRLEWKSESFKEKNHDFDLVN